MPAASTAPAFKSTDLCRIIQRYQTPEDIETTRRAYEFAAKAHANVRRKSGELYIHHPLEVARILADLRLDVDTLCAALLHDVIEDTDYSKDSIIERFGIVVAELVDGVTKLAGSRFTSRTEASQASFQKMMTAMTQDYRVVLIKVADRLHNMRTLGSMPPEKKRRIASETLKIHAPLARKMGINTLRKELQTLCLMHLHPWRYEILRKSVTANLRKNRTTYDRILNDITQALRSQQIESSVFLWEKNLYRIYNEAKKAGKNKDLSNEFDSIEIRVLVNETPECYLALGTVHQLYTPKTEKFKDYVAAGKTYGYQALQTELITYERQLLKIEIQTKQMYQVSQFGVTTHFRFPNSMTATDFSKIYLDRWIKQVADINRANSSPSEFMADVTSDLFLKDIQVYTPRGEIRTLPSGSTPVDFAYEIHTDLGNQCAYAIVDNQRVPLSTQLRNGATVFIQKAANATPQPTWLSFVVTGKARSAIRHWINSRKKGEFIALGKQLLNQALAPYGKNLNSLEQSQLENTISLLKLNDTNDLLSHIAHGDYCARLIAQRLVDEGDLLKCCEEDADSPILIKGTEGLAVELQSCCYPVPGDVIVAHLEKGRGMAIHRAGCKNLNHPDSKPLKTSWSSLQGQTYPAALSIEARNRVGALSSVSNALHNLKINTEEMHISGDNTTKTFFLVIEVTNAEHLKNVAKKLQELELVLSVTRPL
ncbi:MAG: bifunctional GTP diphosphokinase/guanosine-3',5'-bis(diphosphate) 3'-diphosphatase [Proteobacteria bacterium]|nr:MAG: bifunctional GTP diphosphokinase/guanosine-3',5'-bis(diphosphate) 3'-diphosphatase [Pseudomonadota bacterium]